MTDNKKTKYETKEEFIKVMKGYRGWSTRNFTKKIDDFLYDYSIDGKYIFEGDEGYRELQLNEEYNGLFHVLTKGYNKDPFVKDRQFAFRDNSWKEILSYYEEISKGIDEELNGKQQYDIMNSYPYITMIRELTGIRKIDEKLEELKIALGMINSSVRADMFEEIYACIDQLTLQVYNKILEAKEQDEKQLSQINTDIKNSIYMRSMLPENKNKTFDEILSDNDLIKIQKFEMIKEEREKYKYIGEYLLDKLKGEMIWNDYPMNLESDTEKKKRIESISDKIEEHDRFKNQTNEVIKRVTGIDNEQVVQSHIDKKSLLIKELEANINRIKNKYEEIETWELTSKEIIHCMNNNDHEKLYAYGHQLEPRSYYEGYLEFIEEIRNLKKTKLLKQANK